MTRRLASSGILLGVSLVAAPLAAGHRSTTRAKTHLADVRQLTFGGENAEAYWSFDGTRLIFQSTAPPYACDQIFTASPAAGAGEPRAGLDRQGADDLLLLPARRPAGDLRLDRRRRRRAARRRPTARRATSGRSTATTTSTSPTADAADTRAGGSTDEPGLRRRGDGLRQGRLDRLHLDPRRRPRSLPDGRRRRRTSSG